MKRFKFLAMVTLGVVIAGVGLVSWAAPASANAGPHGGYTLTTSACAGCHRAHTAVSPYLVAADSQWALCTSCHGGNVTTDVVHGVQTGATKLDGSPKPLNGGGFVQTAGGVAVTSAHKVEGLPVSGTPSDGVGTAWGSQNGNGTPVADLGVGVSGVLECTSCHNPHGSTNYRILNDSGSTWVQNAVNLTGTPIANEDLLSWRSYQVLATRDDAPNYGFDNGNVNDCPANPTVPAGTATPFPGYMGAGTHCRLRYTSGVIYTPAAGGTPAVTLAGPDNLGTVGMNAFCATCHKSYETLSGSAYKANSLNTPVSTVGPGTPTLIPPFLYPGQQDSGDGHGNVPRYRHSVEKRSASAGLKQALRFAALGIDANPPGSLKYEAMGCELCHYAHGSSAAATPAPGDLVPEGPAGDSALLFYGNRGVCISCHQTVGTPVPPTATPTP